VKIVSLIASATEIVCALGFEDDLVARSHECDHPPSVTRLPAVTSPKFPTDGTSYEIDQRVKAILAEALSVYRVDAEALQRLAPDVIVTQTQCEVCAVSARDVEAALCSFVGSRPRVVSLEPNALADVWKDILRVASALGAEARGRRLVEDLRGRLDAVAARVAGRPRPKVACIEWIDPLMAGGNWVPELVDLAGGENLFGEAGKHSPWMSLDDLVARDPDVIVVLPCGFDVPRTRGEMKVLEGNPTWRGLRAVREGRVFLADGNQYMNRPGPRVVESAEIFAEILHGCDYGHRGRGFE
jgi:iron complex transport system substrate-binding protein